MPDVKMPQLGESVTEGTIGQWLKKVGDHVNQYEPLVEVVTDKVNAEVPSEVAGTLTEICVPEGETVTVGTVLCKVSTDEQSNHSGADSRAGAEQAAALPKPPSRGRMQDADEAAPRAVSHEAGLNLNAKRRYSPAVLTLAQQHDVDLQQVSGSGEGGRITRKDVLAYVEQRDRQVQDAPGLAAAAAVRPAPAPREQSAGTAADDDKSPAREAAKQGAAPPEDVEVIAASAIRKTIARKMVESKHTAPHAWTMVEADVTALAQFREGVKKEFKQREGIDLTYLPFFIQAAVEAIKRYPVINASWVDGQIHVKKRVHISIAVATDNGLVVPVIHDADQLSIAGLAHKLHEIAAKARSGRLTLADVEGGTFTVNNTGAFGSILSQPILNAPQAAILTCEAVVKRPVVVDDAIAIRSMVNLCMSLDHRVLDGWVAGQFLQAVRERLRAFGPQTVLY